MFLKIYSWGIEKDKEAKNSRVVTLQRVHGSTLKLPKQKIQVSAFTTGVLIVCQILPENLVDMLEHRDIYGHTKVCSEGHQGTLSSEDRPFQLNFCEQHLASTKSRQKATSLFLME